VETPIFYRNINDVRNNFKANIIMCSRHKNRNLISNKEVLRRWVEYLNEVLKGEEEGEEN
jgi:hypothetical protein